MLEIVIIVCLAAAFFLVLRHYPDVTERKSNRKNYILAIRNFFAKSLEKKKKMQIEEIKKEISAIQQINDEAKLPELSIQQKYKGLQPEIVRLLCSADEFYGTNDLREAENKAIEVIGKDKRCGEAYIIIGKVAFSRGEFDDAREAYKMALKCNKELAEAYFGLGQIDAREENYQNCIENYSSAVIFDKSRADWYAELGRAFSGIRQFAKAAKAFKKAAAIDIENREYKDLASEAEEKQRAHSSVARMK